MTPEEIGPYRIERELGRGGQAVVLLARDSRLGRAVALKLLTGPASPEAAERLVREARQAARVQHAAIARVHDVGTHEGRPFVVMDYVEGEPLARHLERARRANLRELALPGEPPAGAELAPELARVLSFVEHAARAVHAAHEAGLIHRDLTPANLMVTLAGRPVILDFGLAAESGGDAGSGGTPAYMAPEQIEAGVELPDRRTDVHALGAVLFECLTLRRAFEGAGEAPLRAILSGPAPSPRRVRGELPRELDVLVRVALAPRQDERYQTALDLAEDLRRLVAGEPILARRAPLVARILRHARRRPLVTLGWSATVALLALGTHASRGELARNRLALSEAERSSDLRVLSALEHEAELGFARLPAAVPAMDAWLADAAALEQRVVADGTSADAESSARAELDEGLERLRGSTEDVRERRGEAADLAARTVEAHRERWERAIAAIAAPSFLPHYEGLVITPQVGLVPLGVNAQDRYEFYHPQTGVEPVLEHGVWRVGAETGLVFVLVPGGPLLMGAEPPGPERPLGIGNADPYAEPDESPVHEVELAPFFVSKYEMTRAQWLRMGGSVPPDAKQRARLDYPASSDHAEAELRLGLLGLALPTEAQWEFAARCGDERAWWWGLHLEEFEDDEHVAREVREIGTHFANGYGLFDVLGNASEMVRDWFGSYELPVRAGDGLRLVEDGRWRMVRGTTCLPSGGPDLRATRCSNRQILAGGALRPVRVLEGEWAFPGR